jgi:hypothetical protein
VISSVSLPLTLPDTSCDVCSGKLIELITTEGNQLAGCQRSHNIEQQVEETLTEAHFTQQLHASHYLDTHAKQMNICFNGSLVVVFFMSTAYLPRHMQGDLFCGQPEGPIIPCTLICCSHERTAQAPVNYELCWRSERLGTMSGCSLLRSLCYGLC